MAVQWQKSVNGKRYEVRSAGRTLRLYTNGVCHSEFNPARLLTGSIWDLLTITALFSPPGRVRRVLALGVGGGASLLQLRKLFDPDLITGVEADPVHLEIAHRFFDVGDNRLDLVRADAGEWLEQYEGAPFDLIIDDLFTGTGGEPERAVEAGTEWFRLLSKHLAGSGTLTINFGSRAELKRCGYFQDLRLARRFRSAYTLRTVALDNIVGVFLRRVVDTSTLRANIRSIPELGKALRDRRLRYRIRTIDRPVSASS